MCGLAGILRFDDRPVEPERLTRARGHLLCRGPDGSDVRLDGPCGLLHTRLAVLDPEGGRQPMVLPGAGGGGVGNELAVVFNGEIYNHRDLRRRLEQRGHRFTSDHSDTEVLLHGYREWGADLPAHLEGMFAFALWNPRDRALFLARDRTGKKPLFIHRSPGRLVFASTLSAALALLDETPAIDPDALGAYLTFGFTFDRCLLAGLSELPAAHWMRVDLNGTVQQTCYWRPPPISPADAGSDAADTIERLLSSAVAARLEADVPLGCFLSGGIDSSLIAALAQQRLREGGAGRPLKTFSVSMPDARYDEGPWARRVAEHLSTDHVELTAEPRVENDLRRLIATMGEPLADSSILPTHWLSRAAREHVTVALTGDGGDELFAGYDRYRAMRILARHRRWLRRIPLAVLPAARGADQKSLHARLRRLIDAARHPSPSRQYLAILGLFSPQQIEALGLGDAARPPAGLDWPPAADPADSARRWDLAHYLPFDLLRKVDRASMAVALEVRCPMLDTAVVGLAARLPARILMPRGRLKGLLRRVAHRHLPLDVARRPKMGFAIPLGPWFRTTLCPLLEDHLVGGDHLTDLGCDAAGLRRMVDDHARGIADHTHRLFALLSLSIWRQWLAEMR